MTPSGTPTPAPIVASRAEELVEGFGVDVALFEGRGQVTLVAIRVEEFDVFSRPLRAPAPGITELVEPGMWKGCCITLPTFRSQVMLPFLTASGPQQ